MTAAKTKPEKNLTEGALLPKIIFFTLPLIATSILQLLFNTADTIVVGRWGGATPEECENALAAVGSCGSLINLIITLFFGLSVGAGVCVAHGIGARQEKEVELVVHTSVLASLISSVFVTAFGLCMAGPLLTLMGTDPAVLDEAVPYMTAYFCGMPANMLYNYCAAILRSAGNTTRPLYFLSIAGVVNVLLNLVMVLVFHTGALGVGVATAASQWVSCFLIVRYMMHTDGPCHLDLRKLRIDRRILKKIILIGLPAGLQGMLFSISNVLIQSSINSLGKTVVAGNAAASNLEGYIYVTQNALYHTSLTFVGQNLGAAKLNRVKKSIFYSALLVVVVGLTTGALACLFSEPLLRIFIPEGEAALQAGQTRMYIIASTYFICGLMEVGCGTLRGFGKSLQPLFISLIGSCLLRVVWVFTIFAAFPHSLVALFLSYPVTWTLTASTHLIFTYFIYRKKKRELEAAQQEETLFPANAI